MVKSIVINKKIPIKSILNSAFIKKAIIEEAAKIMQYVNNGLRKKIFIIYLLAIRHNKVSVFILLNDA